MEIIVIAALVAAIAFVVLVFFLIPVLVEVKKTTVVVRTSISNLETQFQPVLTELRELTANLLILTEGLASKTDEVKSLMISLGDTGRNISRINAVIGNVAGVVSTSSLWMTGLKAAGRYAIDRIVKKRR
jgi:uncharacterized protein YoxC